MIKKLILLVAVAFLAKSSQAQITCAAARTQGTGAATITGTVINGAELGSIRYIQDNTGGAAVYGTSLSTVNRGDSIVVSGTLTQYNGLMELTSPTITSTSTGHTVTPMNTTALAGYIEANEGRLLKMVNVTFTSTGTFGGNQNYNIMQNGTAEDVRIVSTSNLVGTTIPVGTVTLVGILSEYNVGTYTGTSYQLILRDLNDIQYAGNPPIFTTPLFQSNITTTSFDVSFHTQNAGNTIIKYGTTPGSMTSIAQSATMTTNHLQALTGLLPATIYYVQGITISASNDTSKSSVSAMCTASTSSGKIKVYFNRTVDNSVAVHGNLAQQLPNACADTLIAFINSAISTLDIAIYNIDNNLGVITAINNATTNGVAVRVICDNGVGASLLATLTTPNKMLAPGSTTYGIMHNKFIVKDVNSASLATVWSGSMNWTQGQLQQDANSIIIIQDQSLAKAYKAEFDEMFTNTFGASKKDNTPHEFVIGGRRVESYFSPSDATGNQIKKHIATANYDIYAGVMSFTKTDIGYTIIDSAVLKNGAYYAGIVDDTSGTGAAAPFNNFFSHGINTELIDKGSYIFHHKYCIIDPNDACSDPTVIVGSHNWSSSADTKNDENTLMVHDSTVANLYYQEFSQRYKDLSGVLNPKPFKTCANSNIGIGEVKAGAAFNIYPNPSTSILNIEALKSATENYQIKITDMMGKTVAIYANQNANTTQQIDLSNLSNGVYAITISSKSNLQTLRVVKQ